MRTALKAMFAILLSMGMLLQGSLASTGQGSFKSQVSVRKCCRTEQVATTGSCHIMRCCRTSEDVPTPVTLRVVNGTEMALVLPAAILQYAPVAARPPTGDWQVGVRYVSSVPLYTRYCSILI